MVIDDFPMKNLKKSQMSDELFNSLNYFFLQKFEI